jgi:hypothetical protein
MHMGLGPENGQPESADRCHAVGSRPANALGAEVTKLSTLTALKYLTFHAWLAIRQRGPLQSSEASVSVLGSRATSAVYLDALQRASLYASDCARLCTSSHRPDLEVADLSCLTTLRSFDTSAKTRYCKTSPRCPFLTALTSFEPCQARLLTLDLQGPSLMSPYSLLCCAFAPGRRLKSKRPGLEQPPAPAPDVPGVSQGLPLSDDHVATGVANPCSTLDIVGQWPRPLSQHNELRTMPVLRQSEADAARCVTATNRWWVLPPLTASCLYRETGTATRQQAFRLPTLRNQPTRCVRGYM